MNVMEFGGKSVSGKQAITTVGLALAISASALTTTAIAATDATEIPVSMPKTTTTHIVEWDIPFGEAFDMEPGAIVVDSHGKDKNRVWFLTRRGAQKIYRFDPAKSLMKGYAQWTSWQLSQIPAFLSSTGGLKRLKPSDDRRYAFVRTNENIQRVDTQVCKAGTAKTAYAPATPPTCDLKIWQDQPGNTNVSDLAVDSMNRVFTTATPFTSTDDPTLDPASAYVQMLTPNSVPDANGYVKVKRWKVGGGAGFCGRAGITAPCLSGIDVYSSKYKDLIYYSEPEGNNIGELNVATDMVRRWSLSKVYADEPRQLIIDRHGKVWVVTGSGHVVSLDPATNKMTSHQVPTETASNGESDLYGVAPDDDVIGYTNSQLTENKVAMVFPKGYAVYVPPTYPQKAPTSYPPVKVTSDVSISESDSVRPQGKIVPVTITPKKDGTFVEARVDQVIKCTSDFCSPVNSTSPLGITPNRGKAQGTFFYTVAFSDAVRIGFARLPRHKEKVKHGRDDDDCDDGEDHTKHPGWHDHDSDPYDRDDDAVETKHDHQTSREDAENGDATPLGAGQIAEYPMTASPTSLALIAQVTATDPFAQMGIEIYNPVGALVASGVSVGGVAVATLPTPGAGAFKVRVKNYGLNPVTQTPTLLVREPWLLP
jgi:hypothetical protein